MFGSVIDKVQSLFSRSFLLGAYFPVLIFAAMNAIIALLGLPEEIVSLAMIKKSWPTDATVQAALTAWIFISIGVVAYILSSLNELLRRILEGRYLLGLVEHVLLHNVGKRINNLREQLNQRRQILTLRRRDARIAMRRLETAAALANPPNRTPAGDHGAVEAAEAALNAAASMLASDIQFSNRLDQAVAAAEAALRANRTKEPGN